MRLHKGKIQLRRTLSRVEEGADALQPQLARFHLLENGTLLLLTTFSSNLSTSELPTYVYRLTALSATVDHLDWVDVPFSLPLPGTFLTSSVRGGSAPSSIIDLVGMSPARSNTLRYARVRIEEKTS